MEIDTETGKFESEADRLETGNQLRKDKTEMDAVPGLLNSPVVLKGELKLVICFELLCRKNCSKVSKFAPSLSFAEKFILYLKMAANSRNQ